MKLGWGDLINREQMKALTQSRGFWLSLIVVLLLIGVVATGNGEALTSVPGGVIVVLLYFLPALIARKKANSGSVFVINLFFGWTVIGWVIALAMAANNPAPTQVMQVTQRQPPRSAPTGRTCPFCAEEIQPAAVVCKHCGRDLPPPPDR